MTRKTFNDLWATVKNAAWITGADDKNRTGLVTRDDAEKIRDAGRQLLDRIDALEAESKDLIRKAAELALQTPEFDYSGIRIESGDIVVQLEADCFVSGRIQIVDENGFAAYDLSVNGSRAGRKYSVIVVEEEQ
jgi:hypothetical protein